MTDSKYAWKEGESTATNTQTTKWTNLLWSSHEVDSSVMSIILLGEAEGELIVNQKTVCGQDSKANY